MESVESSCPEDQEICCGCLGSFGRLGCRAGGTLRDPKSCPHDGKVFRRGALLLCEECGWALF